MKEDQTGNFIPRSSLTLVEANVGIICACLPTLGTLLVAALPRGWVSAPARSYELSDSSKPHLAYPNVENTTTVSADRGGRKAEGAVKNGMMGGHSNGGSTRSRHDPENDSVEELLEAKPNRDSPWKRIEVRKDVSVQQT